MAKEFLISVVSWAILREQIVIFKSKIKRGLKNTFIIDYGKRNKNLKI